MFRSAVAAVLPLLVGGLTIAVTLFILREINGVLDISEIIFIKELGVGTALAVLIDATIVRAFLVPSLMALLGHRNWWAPQWLRRIHDRIGVSEGDPETVERA